VPHNDLYCVTITFLNQFKFIKSNYTIYTNSYSFYSEYTSHLKIMKIINDLTSSPQSGLLHLQNKTDDINIQEISFILLRNEITKKYKSF
jgi:hypothetical protein